MKSFFLLVLGLSACANSTYKTEPCRCVDRIDLVEESSSQSKARESLTKELFNSDSVLTVALNVKYITNTQGLYELRDYLSLKQESLKNQYNEIMILCGSTMAWISQSRYRDIYSESEMERYNSIFLQYVGKQFEKDRWYDMIAFVPQDNYMDVLIYSAEGYELPSYLYVDRIFF